MLLICIRLDKVDLEIGKCSKQSFNCLFQAPGKAERTNALDDVKQACSVIEHSNVNHIR